MENARLVCVTGASGFIGSWVVALLLQRGYSVRATVQNLGDEGETKHLRALEGADTRLLLFQVDLLDYGSLATAIGNSEGVFHLASPNFLEKPQDPEVWYPISKVLAEKAAWKLAEEQGLDVVVINPGCVLGPMLQPRVNASMHVLLNLLKGDPEPYLHTWLGAVSVKDVARAQILLYETPEAKGRHLCTERICHFSDLAEELAQMYPHLSNVHRFKEDTHPAIVRCVEPSKKLISLGFTFTPRKELIEAAVASLQERGLLP